MTHKRRSQAPASEWKDITLPLKNGMPIFPGNVGGPFTDPSFTRIFDGDKGAPVTMTQITMNTHDGTHMDAPLHFVQGGGTIDKMPLDTSVGPALVIGVEGDAVMVSDLEKHDIQPGARVLFKTKNSPHVYDERTEPGHYAYISPEAARYLAEKQVRLVGLDYLTVGDLHQPETMGEVHHLLLDAGIYIIEGLNFDGVEPGDYELICLPLKLENGDGGPCRAILRPM